MITEENEVHIFLVLMLIAVTLGCVGSIIKKENECVARGGVLVEGVLKFECVQSLR